jgi:hypothetical protein
VPRNGASGYHTYFRLISEAGVSQPFENSDNNGK